MKESFKLGAIVGAVANKIDRMDKVNRIAYKTGVIVGNTADKILKIYDVLTKKK